MKKPIESVKKFHEAFQLGYKEQPSIELSEEKIDLRFNLMAEENKEYLEAAKNKDLIEVADALGDMLYILCGTIIEHGMQDVIEDVFDEIQRSNMSKLDKNGNPIFRADGKVLKSDLYFKPNLAQFFKKDR
ncbi:MAG: nucleoside triphosphate pyrophosphohydrolase family protein [Flavobacteriaceae bacterium]|nr:nucleoside triphosphate pyrophosphohydrolase family protein [Flavobacteriaceae bacterium]